MAMKCTAWKKKSYSKLHWWEKTCSPETRGGTSLYCSIEPVYAFGGTTGLFMTKMLKKRGSKASYKVANVAQDIRTLAKAKAQCDLWLRKGK